MQVFRVSVVPLCSCCLIGRDSETLNYANELEKRQLLFITAETVNKRRGTDGSLHPPVKISEHTLHQLLLFGPKHRTCDAQKQRKAKQTTLNLF